MKEVQAYPLAWPTGWKRTPSHQQRRGQFHKVGTRQMGDYSYRGKTDLSIAQATQRLVDELARMGVEDMDIVLSTNLRLRMDGFPTSKQRQPEDPGAAVYWRDRGAPGAPQRCMAIDLYDKVEHNIAALAATIEAMRAIERHGGAEILSRAFTGFTALPGPGDTSGRGWREILGFDPSARPTLAQVTDVYRQLRGRHHPDRPGGNSDEFQAVQRAYELAQQEIAS